MSLRCPICPHTHSCVPGDGPQPARVLFIGERPGKQEDRYKMVFIGPTGDELNDTYLPLAGLKREDVRIVNTVLCGAEQNRKPNAAEIDGCGVHHLPSEFHHTNPGVVVLLGSTACSLVEPAIDLEMEHGVPRQAIIPFAAWNGWVVPMYHPAAGIHDPRLMTYLLEDFESLGEWLGGTQTIPVSQIPVHYSLMGFGLSVHTPRVFAGDSESHGNDPFSIQYAWSAGKARMLRMVDLVNNKLTGNGNDPVDALNKWSETGLWVFHNAEADIPVFEKFGVHVRNYVDTMQMAYHQGNLPQGLKALVYRLFRYKMSSWEDVVMPHSRNKVQEWMMDAIELAKTDLCVVTEKQLVTKVKTMVKAGPVERALQRILKHTILSPDYDPWEKTNEFLDNNMELERVETNMDVAQRVTNRLLGRMGNIPISRQWEYLTDRLGKMPILGIGNVPELEAITYGCSDADWTLRAYNVMNIRITGLCHGGPWDIADCDVDK